MSIESSSKARGLRELLECAYVAMMPAKKEKYALALTPEQELLSACSPCERIAFRVGKVGLWCRAWWKRHGLTVRQIAAPFGYLFLFCLIASVVLMVMALYPDGMAR